MIVTHNNFIENTHEKEISIDSVNNESHKYDSQIKETSRIVKDFNNNNIEAIKNESGNCASGIEGPLLLLDNDNTQIEETLSTVNDNNNDNVEVI